MPDPVEVRAARLGLKASPKAKAKKKTHVLEKQPNLKIKTKKYTKKVKK
jgi:hypothetical protein